MLGTNPIRKQELQPDGLLEVEKVFYTIQGEGPFVGRPAVFVRLSGCWLACHFCDTEFDTNNTPCGVPIVVSMVRRAAGSFTSLVVLTGGDPLRQNILPVCDALAGAGFHIQIETAGIQWVPGLEALVDEGVVSIVCSPKTGKVCDEMHTYASAWKYIISEHDQLRLDDLLPVSSTQRQTSTGKFMPLHVELARPKPFNRDLVYVQPCTDVDTAQTDRNQERTKEVALMRGYRISLQTHKTLGLE